MASDDYASFPAPATVRFERILPGPVERVWSFLIESDKRRLWLAAGDVEPEVGGRVFMTFRNGELSPDDDTAPKNSADCVDLTGRVTAIEPPRLLEHTWPESDGESLVRFELKASGDSVRLIVVHRRLQRRELKLDVSAGWHAHLDVLAAALAGATRSVRFWQRFNEYRNHYEAADAHD